MERRQCFGWSLFRLFSDLVSNLYQTTDSIVLFSVRLSGRFLSIFRLYTRRFQRDLRRVAGRDGCAPDARTIQHHMCITRAMTVSDCWRSAVKNRLGYGFRLRLVRAAQVALHRPGGDRLPMEQTGCSHAVRAMPARSNPIQGRSTDAVASGVLRRYPTGSTAVVQFDQGSPGGLGSE